MTVNSCECLRVGKVLLTDGGRLGASEAGIPPAVSPSSISESCTCIISAESCSRGTLQSAAGVAVTVLAHFVATSMSAAASDVVETEGTASIRSFKSVIGASRCSGSLRAELPHCCSVVSGACPLLRLAYKQRRIRCAVVLCPWRYEVALYRGLAG